MGVFDDCLKVAKFVARFSCKKKIDIESIEIALCFFESSQELNAAISRSHTNFVFAKEKCSFGQQILESYETAPKILFDADAARLRREIEATQAANIDSKFPSDVSVESMQVEVIRLLAKESSAGEMSVGLQTLFPNESTRSEARIFLDNFLAILEGAVKSIQDAAIENDFELDLGVSETAGEALKQGGSKLPILRSLLQQRVLDQPLAARLLCEELQAREWGLVPTRGPGLFLLLGPKACGKTLLTKLIVEAMPERPSLVINMASFSSYNEGFGLTGLRGGYDGAAAGRLTLFVHEHPNAIVVLDNIDRAHPNVQNLLIPLFTEGALVDEFGFGEDAKRGKPDSRRVSFGNAIVLFSSNVGAEIFERADYPALYTNEPERVVALLRYETTSFLVKEESTRAVTKNNKQAQRGQLGEYLSQACILPFQALGIDALTSITQRAVDTFVERMTARGVDVTIADRPALALALTLSQGPEINAKELENAVTRTLLAAYMQTISAGDGSVIKRIDISVLDVAGVLKGLMQKPKAELLLDMFRRRELLSFDVVPTLTLSSVLQLQIVHPSMQRVSVSSDYGGDGGFTVELPNRKFDEVFGHTHIKQRLIEVVRLLKEPGTSEGKVIGLPKGMLLYGQPGTGKTMLAKALAAEADLPFIAVTGPQLLDINLIKSLFKRARKFAPCLVFMDEIDALGVRGSGANDACINQLLTEIDGFVESRDGGVFVIAATNYPQKVDPALTRSGRLDLCLEVPMLDRDARRHFIDRLKELPHSDNWDTELLVDLSAGMTGADLEKLCREATLDLIRRPRSLMTQAELLELLNVIKHGARLENPRLREQMESTAYHEAGHAIVSMALNTDVRVEQVTIVPRRDALGFTAYTEESLANRHFNRHESMDLICVALAGRIAESHQFPAVNSLGGDDAGASSDLARATSIAWQSVTKWGLDNEFGWVSMSGLEESEQMAWRSKAAERVNVWLAEARQLTQEAVENNWHLIDKLATYLLAHEMIDGDSLRQLVAENN